MSAGTHGWGGDPFQSEGLRYPVYMREQDYQREGTARLLGFRRLVL